MRSDARKRIQTAIAQVAAEYAEMIECHAANEDSVARLAEIIHRAIEPVGAEGAPRCPEDDEGFVGCYAAAAAVLASDWLTARDARVWQQGWEHHRQHPITDPEFAHNPYEAQS